MALVYPLGLASTDFADGNTSSGWQPQNFAYGAHFVTAGAGTVTQLGVRGACDTGTRGVKLALYDSTGTLIGSGTATVGASVAWVDSGAVSLSIPSAGTYYVLVSGEDSTVFYDYDTAGNGSFATEAYASFPAASESITAQGDTGQLYGVRMDFTASAGGPPLQAQILM